MNRVRRPAATLTSLFHSGKLSELVQVTLLAGGWVADERTLPLAVGALGALGQGNEAELLLTGRMGDVPPEGRMLAAFHIVQGYCHRGQHTAARRLLGWMLRRRREGNGLARAYLALALGCVRFATGRVRIARWHAHRAATMLRDEDAPYEQYLADELHGHALVHAGRAADGISYLHTAQRAARTLGRKGSQKALTTSLALYEARWSLQGSEAIAVLTKRLAELEPQDRLARASLHLELSRQHLAARSLMGARAALEAAAKALVGGGAPRFDALFLLRRVEVIAASGETATACVMAASLVKVIDGAAEAVLRLEALNRYGELLAHNGQDSAADAVRLEEEKLRRWSGAYSPPPVALIHEDARSVALPTEASIVTPPPAERAGLNLRQVTLLREMRAGEAMDVQAYKRRFEVSEITACRDLAAMTKWGYLQRLGKARATKYVKP